MSKVKKFSIGMTNFQAMISFRQPSSKGPAWPYFLLDVVINITWKTNKKGWSYKKLGGGRKSKYSIASN